MILKTWSETITVYKYIKIIVSLDKNYSNGIWMTMYLKKLPEKQFMQYRNKSSSYFIHKQNLFEAAKSLGYTECLQIIKHGSQNCQPLFLSSRAVFVPKRSYLETNNRSYNSGSNFLQKWEVNPLQSFRLQVSYTCQT